MSIALINGSPKRGYSASGVLINDLKTFISSDTLCFEFNTPKISDDFIKCLNDFDALVFFFPLYVDGVPSHLLSCLCELEDMKIINKNIRVYGVVNCGFYEGIQNNVALEILENWTHKLGLVWGMGVGFGGGGALMSMKTLPIGKGPKASLGVLFKYLAKKIEEKSSSENKYISINFPRFLYIVLAEWGWKRAIKANGGKTKDINNKKTP